MIQVHGDRLIGSFSSSLINKRIDEYGGCLENRMRFALEAVRQVRQHCSLPIDYKLAVRQINPDYGKAGVLEQDLDPVVGWLEQAGVDCFHVTLANHGALTDTIPPANHPAFSAEGCFLKFADQVKALTCKTGDRRRESAPSGIHRPGDRKRPDRRSRNEPAADRRSRLDRETVGRSSGNDPVLCRLQSKMSARFDEPSGNSLYL